MQSILVSDSSQNLTKNTTVLVLFCFKNTFCIYMTFYIIYILYLYDLYNFLLGATTLPYDAVGN